MKLAFWPGLGGEVGSLGAVESVLADAGIDVVTVDPRYGTREDWGLESLAAELVETGADVFAGHSWGGAVAATAASESPPRALVLLEGGFIQPPQGEEFVAEAIANAPDDWTYGNAPLEAILRAYMEYDADATLAKVTSVRTLVVASAELDERRELVEQRTPWADARFVPAGHDVVEDLGASLGGLVCEWLLTEVAA